MIVSEIELASHIVLLKNTLTIHYMKAKVSIIYIPAKSRRLSQMALWEGSVSLKHYIPMNIY
jgi:hypothetical protein